MKKILNLMFKFSLIKVYIFRLIKIITFEIIKIYIFIICLIFSLPTAFAVEPLMITNNNLWNENTKIFVANCGTKSMQESISNLYYINNENILDLVYVESNKKEYLYLVNNSALIRIDLLNPSIKSFYALNQNFSTAFITLGQFVCSNKKFQLLCLTANNGNQNSFATLFNISDPTNSLKPINGFESGFQGNIKELSRSIFIKQSEKQFSWIIGGKETTGIIAKLNFSDIHHILSKFSEIYRTPNKESIVNLMALDTNQTGFADQLIFKDSKHLWRLNLANYLDNNLQIHFPDNKSSTMELLSNDIKFDFLKNIQFSKDLFNQKMIAHKNLTISAINLYYLSYDEMNKTNLLKKLIINDKLIINNNDNYSKNLNVKNFNFKKMPETDLKQNNLHSIFLRSGRLILVPKLISSNDSPKYIDLSNELKFYSPEWHFIIKAKSEKILKTKLLWDPKNEQEVLVTLDEQCEIQVLKASITKDKYGRLGWRSCQE